MAAFLVAAFAGRARRTGDPVRGTRRHRRGRRLRRISRRPRGHPVAPLSHRPSFHTSLDVTDHRQQHAREREGAPPVEEVPFPMESPHAHASADCHDRPPPPPSPRPSSCWRRNPQTVQLVKVRRHEGLDGVSRQQGHRLERRERGRRHRRKVDEIIVGPDGKAPFVVLSVGGFLGVGDKLVALPYEQMRTMARRSSCPAPPRTP